MTRCLFSSLLFYIYFGHPGECDKISPCITCSTGKHSFELWCWRRLLRVPWIARRSNLSILNEINPEYSLEGLMLTLKLHYFGHLMQKADSLEKTLMLGKIGEEEGTTENEMVGWHHRLDGHNFINMKL